VKIFRSIAISLCALLISGCSVDEEAGSWQVASTRSEVLAANRIAFNRIAFNRIAFNRIAFNRIAFNRIAFNRIAFNSLDNLEHTPEGRDVLLYLARCALNDGDVLVATHGNQTYEFPGLLGLAPEWEHRGLTDSEARWISGCLIAHVNAFDVSVEISLRAPQRIQAVGQEAYDFPVYEATFFGHVFDDETLEAYACVGNDVEIATSHAPDRAWRVCADHGPCEVTEVGHCRDVCGAYLPGIGWTDCEAGGYLYAETVSVFLRSQGESCRAMCPGSGLLCNLLCPSASPSNPDDDSYTGPRILDCNRQPGLCTASCRGGACLIEASETEMAFVTIEADAMAELQCVDTDECVVSACEGEGTRCNVDCTNADSCKIERCAAGASCLLDCTGVEDCTIAECHGTIKDCPGDVRVCNRPCPEP
jgi:hypothetical protein